MRARYLDLQTLEITGIGFLEGSILWRISAAADPTGSRAAEERIASSPTRGGELEIDEDWQEHVIPELRTLFASAVEIVRHDLVNSWLHPGTDAALRIPLDHVEAWLLALNQARLALAARHSFTDESMNDQPPLDLQPETVARIFVDFFGGLQHLLLEATAQRGGGTLDSAADV